MTLIQNNCDTDIDIDFANRDSALEHLNHVKAMLWKDDRTQTHPSGVYFQQIPLDATNGLAALDYKKAAQFGYFKIDFLNSSIYENVEDEEHLIELMEKEPNWSFLEFEDNVNRLSQLSNHFHIVNKIKPTTVEELAITLALIRPGKIYLQNETMEKIKKEIWTPVDGYYYKKSHAIAYAMAIVIEMNLICEDIERESYLDDIFI